MSRARGYNRRSRIFFLLLLILLVAALAVGAYFLLRPESGQSEQNPQLPGQQEEPEPEPEPLVAHLVVGGDAMSHMPQTNDARTADGSYDYTPMMASLQRALAGADFAVCNLETVLGGGPEYSGFPYFNSPDALAQNLRDVGFDLLSTANNHSMDQGFDGLCRTLDVLDQVGLQHVGTYRSQEEYDQNKIVVADVGGISVAFLSYTYGTNGIPVREENDFSINIFNVDYMTTLIDIDEDRVKADMDHARSLGADLIAVMVHWGTEYKLYESTYQQEMAQLLFDEGADIILGGHPHVLQPMGFRQLTNADGTTRTGFVCYSLGNLISSQNDEYTDTTALLDLKLVKDPITGETTIAQAGYLPFYMLDREEEINGERFILLNVHEAINWYDQGQRDVVTDEVYQKLLKARDDCHMVLADVEDEGVAVSGGEMLWGTAIR